MQVSAFPAIFKADFGRFRRVSACSGRFSACFNRIGRWPIRPDMADTTRFWPNQPGSARIETDSARIELHRHESSRVGANPRKKKTQTRSDARATASDAGAAPLVPRSCFLGKNANTKFNLHINQV